MITVPVWPLPCCPALLVLILILWEEIGVLPAPSSVWSSHVGQENDQSHWIKFTQPQASTLTNGIPISYFLLGWQSLSLDLMSDHVLSDCSEFFALVIVPNVMLILWTYKWFYTQTMVYVIMERLFGASFACDWDCGCGIKLNLLFFPELVHGNIEVISSHPCFCAQQEVSSYSNIIYLPSSCILLPAVTAHKCLRFVWTSFALKSNV